MFSLVCGLFPLRGGRSNWCPFHPHFTFLPCSSFLGEYRFNYRHKYKYRCKYIFKTDTIQEQLVSIPSTFHLFSPPATHSYRHKYRHKFRRNWWSFYPYLVFLIFFLFIHNVFIICLAQFFSPARITPYLFVYASFSFSSS